MTVENFLKDAVDDEAINRYLQLLAERQLNSEQTNIDLNEYLQLSKQTLVKVEQQDIEIRQLKNQIDSINIELNRLRQRSKIIETQIGQFIAREDGTAFDTTTNLTWCRFSIGQRWENASVLDNAIKMNWHDAMEIAKSFNKNDACGGFTDWRLPSHEELKSLVDDDKSPSINQVIFHNTPKEAFWSSSNAIYTNCAMFVNFGFGNGGNDNKSNKCAVRLVRC